MRAQVAAIVDNDAFRNFILGIIILNAVTLGLETSDRVMASPAGAVVHWLDNIFLTIFVLELALKLFAQRLAFFTQPWNLFDAAVVGVALAPGGGSLSVLRALRILRVLRVISIAPRLRRVVEGFISALPGMGSVFLLMGIIFYIASVMAVKFFGDTHPDWFGTIGEAAYSLFQIMTLESWSMGIVRPVMEVHPWAWAFFVPFIMMTTFAVVNLLVGLIVNSMQDAHAEETTAATDSYREEVLQTLARLEGQVAELRARLDTEKPG